MVVGYHHFRKHPYTYLIFWCVYVLYNYCHNFMENQVPEDRLGRLEQEYRTLALELRLSISVAEEATVGAVFFFFKAEKLIGKMNKKTGNI